MEDTNSPTIIDAVNSEPILEPVPDTIKQEKMKKGLTIGLGIFGAAALIIPGALKLYNKFKKQDEVEYEPEYTEDEIETEDESEDSEESED